MTISLRTLLLGAGLALLSSAAFAAPAVTVAEAGFATGPGTDYDTHGTIAIGTHVDVVWCGTHGLWCLVNFHNKMGWVPLSSLNFKVGGKAGASVGEGGNGGPDDPDGPEAIPAQDAVLATAKAPRNTPYTGPIGALHGIGGITVIPKP